MQPGVDKTTLAAATNHISPASSWHGTISPSAPSKSAPHRYHLYIGLFCPFAHRANLARHLAGLTDIIDISVVKPYPTGDDKGWPGWRFLTGAEQYEGATKDESEELLRFLPTTFTILTTPPTPSPGLDLYPTTLRAQIEQIATYLQRDLNSGVYRTSFAPDQTAYNADIIPVFDALNKLEHLVHSNGRPYVLDIKLYATLIRFDVVYVQHFKCNLGMVKHDYPVLHNWMKGMYWGRREFMQTVDFRHIKENYTKGHLDINPKAITPLGPVPDIESGVEQDWSKVKPGGVQLPAVLEYESKL